MDDPLFGGQRTLERRDVDAIVEAARKRPDEVRDAAGDFGTAAHGLIERILSGEEVVPTPPWEPVVKNFLAWREQAGLTITASERIVYSKANGFAGTLDGLATRDGVPVVLDWKTSNGLWPEMRLQVAAYALALSEIERTGINEAWIVRFNKDTPKRPEDAFEAVKLDGKALADAQSAFLSALWLWRWLNPKKAEVNGAS